MELISYLSSTTQLTHAGYYSVLEIGSAINDNVVDTNTFTDYNAGDFKVLLISSSFNDQGCRFGTLIITSPRFQCDFWTCQIWENKFVRFKKVTTNSDLEPIDLSDQIIMNNGWTKLLFRCIKVGKLLSITATIKSPTSLTGTYTPIFTFPSNIKMRNDMQRITLSLYDGVNIGEAFAVFYKEHNQLRIDNNYTFGYKTSTSYIFNCVVPIE